MSTDSFGSKMRWRRVRAGVPLEQISRETKIPVELWEAMEAGDFSAWPRGIYARAALREYANITGLDADAVIDDFCRLFPDVGDRRREPLVRGQAQIVGHTLQPLHELPPGIREDRRVRARTGSDTAHRRRPLDLRIAAAILDQLVVVAAAASVGVPAGRFWMALGLLALAYYGAAVAWIGCSFGSWAIRTYSMRRPSAKPQADVFAIVPHGADHS